MESSKSHIPLLAPKPIAEFTPEDYMAYVESLYIDWRKPKVPKREFLASRTKKGTIVIRISRKPKWITRAEIDVLAGEMGLPKSEMFLLVCKRKIEVKNDN